MKLSYIYQIEVDATIIIIVSLLATIYIIDILCYL